MSARIDALEMDVGFEPGEEIRTEISCKFTRETLEREYAGAGLRLVGWYTDPDGLFALSLTGPATLTLRRRCTRTPLRSRPRRGVRLARPAGAGAASDRPYAVANMVATADGRATLGGTHRGHLERHATGSCSIRCARRSTR